MLNKLQVIGRVGQDPQVKTANNKQVANFSVATSKKINGEQQTTWVEVALWDKPNVYPYIKKGGLVYVEGEASVNAYITKDGTAAASLRLSAYQIQLLGGNSDNQSQPAQTNEGPQTSADDEDTDLPF